METIRFNKNKLQDKIHAAWIGKNIGGTIGVPYEWTQEFLDVKGFISKPGEPLPNDDLDLQLVWLHAMETEGPYHFNARILSEYWMRGIVPEWNEYGIGKANLRDSIMPPLSGELHNDVWKNSNGAWIRTEIWACLTPGYPELTQQYVIADATVDHGFGEGTYAAMFIAALESLAFFNDNRVELIEKALCFIPENCRIANAVNLVMREYKVKTPYREVRDMLVKQSADIGWFQAPANVGFVVIGLLYGEGDFKNSVLYAVNCGDDTDCTAGTVGAIMGILYGTAGIPKDWWEHINDGIKTICINTHVQALMPKTCTELTERILRLIPTVFLANNFLCELNDSEDILSGQHSSIMIDGMRYLEVEPWSFELPYLPHIRGFAGYDRAPIVKEGEEISLRMRLINFSCWETCNLRIRLILPEGWTAEYQKTVALTNAEKPMSSYWNAKVKVGQTQAKNHIYAIAESPIHAQPLIVDFYIEG